MNISDFIAMLKGDPDSVEFNSVIDLIDNNYHFIPTTFSNGEQLNKAGGNNGSCKIFAFSQLHNLTEQQTLAVNGHLN